MSILARTKPHPTYIKDTYICKRCGIQRTAHGSRQPTYCLDCRPYAKDTQ